MTILTILDFILNRLPFGFITDGFKTRVSSFVTAAIPVLMALSGIVPGLEGVVEFLDSLLLLTASGITWGLAGKAVKAKTRSCLLYTSPSPRDQRGSRMPSSA